MKNIIKKYMKIKYIPIFIIFIACLLTVVILYNRNSVMSFNHDKWINALKMNHGVHVKKWLRT
jgi:hypothetical protein